MLKKNVVIKANCVMIEEEIKYILERYIFDGVNVLDKYKKVVSKKRVTSNSS